MQSIFPHESSGRFIKPVGPSLLPWCRGKGGSNQTSFLEGAVVRHTAPYQKDPHHYGKVIKRRNVRSRPLTTSSSSPPTIVHFH
jgi:hypothetical protein